MNTKQKGIARVIIFPSSNKYKAVCLDFDIVEEAETREEVENQIKEAVKGYIMNACKNNLTDKLLNRKADTRYWKMYENYLKLLSTRNKSTEDVSRGVRGSSFYSFPINELIKEQALCVS